MNRSDRYQITDAIAKGDFATAYYNLGRLADDQNNPAEAEKMMRVKNVTGAAATGKRIFLARKSGNQLTIDNVQLTI